MDLITNESQNELHKLRKDLQKGLDDMLTFNNNLSRFDKRTLELFLTLKSDHTKYDEVLKRLEELEDKLS